MMRQFKSARHANRGVSLIEAMLLVLTLAIVSVAVGVGLQSLSRAPKSNDQSLAISNALIDQMEYYHSLPFASLVSTTNNTFTVNGIVTGLTVTVTTADPNFGASPQTDFKQVVVTIAGKSATTYVSQ